MSYWTGFYSGRYGDLFMRRNGRPGQHRGVDIPGYDGQQVPSYVSGTVIKVGYTRALGYYVSVAMQNGRSISWVHLKYSGRARLGAKVSPGTIIGRMAGWGDDHGTMWTGIHVHFTNTNNGDPAFGQVIDPMPGVRSALANANSTTPASPKPPVVIPPTIEEVNEYMEYRMITYTNPEGRRWAIAHPVNLPAGFEETADPNTARHWQNSLGVYDVWGSGNWDEYKRVRDELGAWRSKYLAAKKQEK